MILNEKIKELIGNYAKASTAEEVCGLLIEREDKNQLFYPCQNEASDKANNFKIGWRSFITAQSFGQVVAVVHSHIGKKPMMHLSASDRQSQYLVRMPWVLCVNGEIKIYEPIRKLKYREFKEGYCDCYDSFKDFYALAGLEMGDYSPSEGYRIPDWHKEKGVESPFLKFMESEGFYQIKGFSEMEPGDVILSLLGAEIPNHASVYVGNNNIFHHLPGRSSGVETLRKYFIDYKHSIWRHKDSDKLRIKEVIELLNKEVI